MKLFLFGGAEVALGQVELLLKLVEQVIQESGTTQVLHIPFARPKATEVEWEGDWYHRYIHLPEVEYLNANDESDILKARAPLVFMSGGSNSPRLVEMLRANKRLLDLVQTAPYIIGESGGAKALGTYLRPKGDERESKIIQGLGIVRNTIIEPHYTQRNRQELLLKSMQQSGVRYGIGIDALTAIVFEREEFPAKYSKIGEGTVEIKDAQSGSS